MPADVVDNWLKKAKPARIANLAVRPLEHPSMKGVSLSVQRGQAEVFPLVADDGSRWLLKKFHRQRSLDRCYLESIGSLLPAGAAFVCGSGRRILDRKGIQKTPSHFYSAALADWLDETVLMPASSGRDWASIADDLRDGSLTLDMTQRVQLCRSLSRTVQLLESAGCSHRDLSSGNVFITPVSLEVCLIDFDSLFHPTLTMPAATTCGTSGYTPPFAWRHGQPDAAATWCPGADRYSLSLLDVEFLVVRPGSPITNEGGIFDQEQLRSRRGEGLARIRCELSSIAPAAVPLIEATLRSASCSECPAPDEWLALCDRLAGPMTAAPSLADLEAVPDDYFRQLLRKKRPAAPVWPAPRLADLPRVDMAIPAMTGPVVSLPEDPWRS